ncbi:O-methyltransferase [Streptomyces sp. G45]|uniref:O-methyltransferase n=1 Tax=Streptomyces sp. G45 TaxID=3406627 RepID=UPI003C27AA73
MPSIHSLTDARLRPYVLAHSLPLGPVARDLIDTTRRVTGDRADMQLAPEQCAFLTLLVKTARARDAIEIGTFTGLSALAIVRGLQPGGRLMTCDVHEEWTAVADAHWRRENIRDRIDLRLAPALETLRCLSTGTRFDFAFIDADKVNYPRYWTELVPRMRPGALIVVDNVLWKGAVVDGPGTDERTRAISELNALVARDARVEAAMLTVADGMTIARVR